MKPTTLLLTHAFLLLHLGACQVESTSDAAPVGQQADAATETATFAGGCFWCMEKPFEVLPGVSAVISGYAGGHVEEPTYEEVGSGGTGHAEAIQVHYDPTRIAYDDLLEVFWRQIDPTDASGQFVDRGDHYRSAVFYESDAQRAAAETSKEALDASGRFDEPIVTEITPLERFWEAEDYHQDFYRKSPARYHSYRSGSGRDAFLDRVWGEEREYVPEPPTGASRWERFEKPSDAELRERLTDLQYRVTQENATERPFQNEYWDEKRAGIYVDVVSGEPLFSSLDKFESGTGWPSFTRPLVDGNIVRALDHELGYPRTEVRSRHANSHLGHVFEDGPAPTGLRYCINSAALRFVPKRDLEAEGFGDLARRFEE